MDYREKECRVWGRDTVTRYVKGGMRQVGEKWTREGAGERKPKSVFRDTRARIGGPRGWDRCEFWRG